MTKPIEVYCGYDPRERIGWHVFAKSVIEKASRPVSLTPLAQCGLDAGSNAFTLSRFLVPYMQGFKGHAIFADASDMLCLDDIAKLDEMFDPSYAIQVVKHPDYTSRHVRKYVGTSMECLQSNYSRKNWMSVAIYNCAHPSWAGINLDRIAHLKPIDLLQLHPFRNEEIGEIPARWNVLVDEGQIHEDAAILHWSSGMPGFPYYTDAPRSREWWAQRYELTDTLV